MHLVGHNVHFMSASSLSKTARGDRLAACPCLSCLGLNTVVQACAQYNPLSMTAREDRLAACHCLSCSAFSTVVHACASFTCWRRPERPWLLASRRGDCMQEIRQGLPRQCCPTLMTCERKICFNASKGVSCAKPCVNRQRTVKLAAMAAGAAAGGSAVAAATGSAAAAAGRAAAAATPSQTSQQRR